MPVLRFLLIFLLSSFCAAYAEDKATLLNVKSDHYFYNGHFLKGSDGVMFFIAPDRPLNRLEAAPKPVVGSVLYREPEKETILINRPSGGDEGALISRRPCVPVASNINGTDLCIVESPVMHNDSQQTLPTVSVIADRVESKINDPGCGPVTITFRKYGKYKLSRSVKNQLDKLIPCLNKAAKSVNVVGYACNSSRYGKNKRVSLARAKSVASYLQKHGIKVDSVMCKSAANPICSDKQLNRRVKISFTYPFRRYSYVEAY